MTKVTLDRETFKALASDTRLNILRTLDGKKLGLNDISKATNLNKATLHEHLSKLNQAGLVKKKEREGHKWVYYKLTWKGENLLHPENTKIVVLFSLTFIALWAGIIQIYWYVKGTVLGVAQGGFANEVEGNGLKEAVNNTALPSMDEFPQDSRLFYDGGEGVINVIYQNPLFLYIGIICFTIFLVVLCFAIWKAHENRKPKL
jgi:DNA-binding transcriptional ArsR family regulator